MALDRGHCSLPLFIWAVLSCPHTAWLLDPTHTPLDEAPLTFGRNMVTTQRGWMALRSIKPSGHQDQVWSKLLSNGHHHYPEVARRGIINPAQDMVQASPC